MILRLTMILVLAGTYAAGQSLQVDTSNPFIINPDTFNECEVDSINRSALNEYAGIRRSYDSIGALVKNQTSSIKEEIDSLRSLNRPVDRLLVRLDSLAQWKKETMRTLDEKVARLKGKIRERIAGMGLPPELQNKENELTETLNRLDLPLTENNIPLSLDDNLTANLENPLSGIHDLDLPDTGEIGEEMRQYQEHLSAIPADLEEASSIAEEQAMKLIQVDQVKDQLGETSSLTEMAGSLPDQEAIKDELVQEARQQAIDHFQGKEEHLQKAMETLAKYKQKYSKLEGLDDIPKRKPNEMRDRKFVERLVPGIALQIHRKDAWLVDFNVYAGYRLNARLTAGAGWNQRVAYDTDLNGFASDLRIYGPRAFGEYAIGRGFGARLEVEYMNTWVPPIFSSRHSDARGREWVFSTMAGVKKEYQLVKNMKGTMMLLYNLHDPHHRSPYGDKLNVRIGFEFPVKKKHNLRVG